MANYQIDISYDAESSNASWKLDGQQPTPIVVSATDTVSFHFDGPGTLSSAILLTGPIAPDTPASPFRGGAQINIAPDYPLAISGALGLWGFAVSFTTTQDGISSFYFLPDPELEVGPFLPDPV
jgi:hypothetical protein